MTIRSAVRTAGRGAVLAALCALTACGAGALPGAPTAGPSGEGSGGGSGSAPVTLPPTAPEIDPCSLVTADEAGEVVDGAEQDTPSDELNIYLGSSMNVCRYAPPDANSADDGLVVVQVANKPFEAEAFTTKAEEATEPGGDPLTIEAVPDVGDAAYLASGSGLNTELWVLTGDRVLAVMAYLPEDGFDPDRTVELARTALTRMP